MDIFKNILAINIQNDKKTNCWPSRLLEWLRAAARKCYWLNKSKEKMENAFEI